MSVPCCVLWSAVPSNIIHLRDSLLPLIDADSRAALWVLVTIYHGLLLKNFEGGERRIYQSGSAFRRRRSWPFFTRVQ